MTASVQRTDAGVRMAIEDTTTGSRAARLQTVSRISNRSAEWIVEAPSSCNRFTCRVLPLARFGAVSFTRATATGDGHAGTILDRNWQSTAIVLVPGASHELFPGGPRPERRSFHSAAGIVTGRVDRTGGSFTAWWRASPSVPAAQ